jgi:signal transduction histidine kinase
MRRSGENEDRSEVLLAQLQDAREAEAQAAALAERGRIAGELHDVLAHSLSGLAIQIEGARLLADREQASPRLRQTIGRSAELVKEGLSEARQAVGALRGDKLPGVADLADMVERFGRDAGISATFSVEGDARPLPRDAETALYRGAQEALTNVARYAPTAQTTVILGYAAEQVTLTVADRAAVTGTSPLAGMGGGNGLAAMAERVHRAGGTVQAGPTKDGWQVEIRVPR